MHVKISVTLHHLCNDPIPIAIAFCFEDGEHKLDQFADTFYLFDTKIFNLCESMHDAWESHQPEQSCNVHMVGGFVYLLA